ncbi:J domain-containing protein [Polymorphobacter fuscus]|uniref:DnaJ domain-containing protein n=1 Tax=Sandarakinorhabdus fusca TaxID=1439888 RepID=A0A7C9KMZ2_9SPHN|nr:DnaJ family molecular chaperone [Polymorphobacter fuscus]KAB7646126.1 DnaJ domain-containing protein [Polymorphobacter fuscus]MQT17324.1 DnaJ domain-containing protein [Polymorphobacter fuscus]NJC10143.1 DnaJ like chaperone protein [Polymorphobacter fuscus]
MSVWVALAGAAAGLLLGGPLGALAGAAAGGALDLGIRRTASPDRRRVAFTIAAIALAAKMARADGEASAAEFATFQRLFHVEQREADNARRFYDLAKQSMAGFEAYADQAATLLGAGSPVLEDLLDALWLIAAVDGFHPAEIAYLDAVAARLGFDAAATARVRARHLAPADVGSAADDWAVLGVTPGADAATLRRAYHDLVRQYHPDRHLAEGVPAEFIRVAESRMAIINAAYARVTGKDNGQKIGRAAGR